MTEREHDVARPQVVDGSAYAEGACNPCYFNGTPECSSMACLPDQFEPGSLLAGVDESTHTIIWIKKESLQ